jgi:hypothetical protein
MIGLLSYPKSGSTLVRYLFEYITNQSTIHLLREKYRSVSSLTGTDYVDKSKPPILIKKHYVDKEIKTCDILVLLVRDYTEVIPSYLYSRLKNKRPNLNYVQFKKEFKPENMQGAMLQYCRNRRLWQKWTLGKRFIIEYEDLVTRPERVIRQIYNILGGCFNSKCASLLGNYSLHSERVMNFKKHNSGLRLNTAGDLNVFKNLLAGDQIEGLHTLYKNCRKKLGI